MQQLPPTVVVGDLRPEITDCLTTFSWVETEAGARRGHVFGDVHSWGDQELVLLADSRRGSLYVQVQETESCLPGGTPRSGGHGLANRRTGV